MGDLAHEDGHIVFANVKKLFLQDYYFISTSGPSNVQSMVGGFCQSHNMKVVFKVLDPEMVAAAVEAAKSVGRVNSEEVIRINSEIKPIVSTKKSVTTTERPEGERRRKRKEKEASQRSTTKPSELQKFLAKRGFSSSSSRGPESPKALTLLFLLLLPHEHITQLFPFLPR